MIIPVGERYQQTLYLLRKSNGKLNSEALRATLFVPMTGEAESQRKVRPDAQNPQVANGSFEVVDEHEQDNVKPAGWHYQRQVKLETGADAPDGTRFAVFRNAEPGRGSQALQGFAVDGRKVSVLQLSLQARGTAVYPGPTPGQSPGAIITFYDERRAAVGEGALGQLTGTFEWHEHTKSVSVPLRAREAILRIGLHGGIGELAIDHVQLEAIKPLRSQDARQ
jgi:protein-L-isoaspartate(D-aspartate) O-methyltransferase